jgi:cysteine synthase B
MAYRFAPSEPHQLGESLLGRIGNTPLLRLRRVTRGLAPAVEVYVKAEWFNPGGSVKDRPVLRIIEDAERDGRLTRERVITDSSSGNAGIAYALIAAVKGYRLRLFVPGNVSVERKQVLAALGAEVTYTDPLEGSDGAIMAVRAAVAAAPHRYFFGDQYNNPSNVRAHVDTTGPEIAGQTDHRITHFVAGVGTSGTLVGVGRYLAGSGRPVEIIAVEPDRALHGIEGLKHLASSIVPGIYDAAVPHRTIEVSTEAAYAMARTLAQDEGLLVGQSSGAAVVGALAVARHLDEGIVVTICPDGADRYLSTALWNEQETSPPPDLLPVATRFAAGIGGAAGVVTRTSLTDGAGIIVTPEQVANLVAQAVDESPHECCGLLAGRSGRAERMFRGTNVDHSPLTYYMDPKEVLRATREIDDAGMDLLAIYHSHTHTPAYPSPTDIAKAHYPDSLYLIISLKDPARPEIRGYRIVNGRVVEKSVIIR